MQMARDELADSAQGASVMVIGREEVLPIELLEKHAERGEWTLFSFPLCSVLVLIPST